VPQATNSDMEGYESSIMVYYQKYSYYHTKKQGKNDSKFEAGLAKSLELRKKAGEIKDFQEQVKIPLIVNNLIVCDYKIDFVVTHNDGTLEYIEAKGYATDVWKLKWKLFEALYSGKPSVKLTVEYQGKNWRPRLRKVKG
jgi:hypothetical protein